MLHYTVKISRSQRLWLQVNKFNLQILFCKTFICKIIYYYWKTTKNEMCTHAHDSNVSASTHVILGRIRMHVYGHSEWARSEVDLSAAMWRWHRSDMWGCQQVQCLLITQCYILLNHQSHWLNHYPSPTISEYKIILSIVQYANSNN